MKKAMLVVYILIAAYVLVFIFGMQMAANAQEAGTWRYGSPNDVRQAGINAAQRGDQIATARWMDIAFRAGSPQLYRYTMPQYGSSIVINNNVTVYANPAAAGVVLGNPDPVAVEQAQQHATSYHTPKYPSALVP